MALVEDQWALVRAGRSNLGDYLQLAESMKNVRNRAAWETMDAHLDYVGDYVVSDADRAQYQAWVRNLLQPTMQELGWKAAPEESTDRKGLRATVAFTLGYAGRDPETIAQATRLVNQAMSGSATVDPTLLASMTQLAAINGDAALYQRYLAAMKAAKSPEEYYRYFYGLAEFRRPELVQRNLEYALSPEVRNQDATGFLGAMLRSTDASKRAQVWTFVKGHWPGLENRLASYTRGEIFGATSAMCDAGERDDVQAFFAEHRIDSADRTMRQSVERMNMCISMRTQQSARLQSWLKQQPAGGGN